MSFQEKYINISDIVKEEIKQVSKNITSDIDIEEPLKSKLSNFLNSPSKHIRPLVAFLFLKALGKDIDEKQIAFQTAIELVHNASLIHDDIIDESSERRNMTSINKENGNNIAVISGDYLLSIALNKILPLNSIEIVKMLSDTLKEMTKGEIKQHYNKFVIPNLDDYIKKTEQKTAKLFEASLCGSLFLAETNYSGAEFARNFGIAFQIRDDLINIKTSRSDIKEGVYTAPVIFSGNPQNPHSGIEKTKDLLNNYIYIALNSINKLPDSKYKVAIRELLGLIKDE